MQRKSRVWRLLPPRRHWGAPSTSSTLRPASRAVIAAHRPALPPPITRTSVVKARCARRHQSSVISRRWALHGPAQLTTDDPRPRDSRLSAHPRRVALDLAVGAEQAGVAGAEA